MISNKTASKKISSSKTASNKTTGKKMTGKKATGKKIVGKEQFFEATPIIIKGFDPEPEAAGSLKEPTFHYSISGSDFIDLDLKDAGGLENLFWTESSSIFPLFSGIESVVIGESGEPDEQICKTSSYVHPLTLHFVSAKNGSKKTILTMREDSSSAPKLNIIASEEDSFTITGRSTQSQELGAWKESQGVFSEAIDAIEIFDAGGNICGRLLVNPHGLSLTASPAININVV